LHGTKETILVLQLDQESCDYAVFTLILHQKLVQE